MVVTQRDFDRKESDLERQFERDELFATDDALRDPLLEAYRRGRKDGLELAKWEVCD